ncbi:prepilin-type N-terminal cleavage/methylation domain-containing protein [Mesorhizobium sp. M1060]|uniref:prepilin-type N-terminal cleavage/methylation domain-containing protein n=1 Tax=unclassified Mesorhizobium TaxID=325217 RepID=UPI0003CE047F|nr:MULTISPECIES: GspH/FimT family pseudopilin [unclassified Mesorhizobium]ESW89438.1 general secretion pathway protein H [Mesorhizobium sp. LSJC269B00]ESZ08224.1 general secretion pathway protein H [Mesorhizobium sp. L2C089B000]ESZ31782.1 general secretion pathway protein H [Mesorhizobium sp. L2C067A000]WJI53533.1 prepilin-type N-terminal cleavage/methylation domain-containing protein [Mesorhizobium sp. C089B]
MTAAAAKASQQAEAGFTLVEMLVVLAIMALMAAIAAPGLVSHYRSKSLETLAGEITMRLRLSRTSAIATARPREVLVDLGARTIRFGERDVFALPDDVKLTVVTGQETVVAGRQTVLTFLPDGSASGMDISLQQKARTARIAVNWLTGLPTWRALP